MYQPTLAKLLAEAAHEDSSPWLQGLADLAKQQENEALTAMQALAHAAQQLTDASVALEAAHRNTPSGDLSDMFQSAAEDAREQAFDAWASLPAGWPTGD